MHMKRFLAYKILASMLLLTSMPMQGFTICKKEKNQACIVNHGPTQEFSFGPHMYKKIPHSKHRNVAYQSGSLFIRSENGKVTELDRGDYQHTKPSFGKYEHGYNHNTQTKNTHTMILWYPDNMTQEWTNINNQGWTAVITKKTR